MASAPSEILVSHDTGYYATLELQYGCSKADIASQFTKLAAAINPDGNIKDSATATQFQKLLTAYEVLNDDNARSGYDRILQYRYYLEQPSTADPATPLPPHLVFCIQKINENKVVQTRLLKLDFVREEFTNWDKDVLRTTHKFSDIKGLQSDVAGKPNEWIITFKTYPRPYHYRSATVREKVMLCAIVRGMLTNKLTVTRDDIELPLKSDLRGWVQQKGGSGLFAKRFVLIGPSNLLVFRNSRCTNMTVCLNLVPGEVKLTFGDNLSFSLIAKEQAVTIKLDSQEQFSEWASHLSDLLEKPDDAAKLRRSRANSSMPFTGDDIRHHKPASEYNSDAKDEENLAMPTGQISINLDDLDLGDIPQTVKSGLQAQLMLDGGDAQQTLSRIEYAINLKKRELEDLNNMRKLLKKQLGLVTSNVFQKVSVRIGTFFSKEPEENFL